MKSKDQQLLEEAYGDVVKSVLFRDKNKVGIKQGDQVVYDSALYTIVGSKSALGQGIVNDMIQLEPLESEESVPNLLWVKPSQVVKHF